jgi:hypothetical protein
VSQTIAKQLAWLSVAEACLCFTITCLVMVRTTQFAGFQEAGALVFLCMWCGSPHLTSGAIALLTQRFLGPALIVFAGTVGLGAIATWITILGVQPLPPGAMHCGPPLILIGPVAHWVGVVLMVIVAATVFAVAWLIWALTVSFWSPLSSRFSKKAKP